VPTEAEVEAATRMLADHMREQLKQHGMDDSDAAVREACRRRLRARLALCERPDGRSRNSALT
jgi:hypothetical protein